MSIVEQEQLKVYFAGSGPTLTDPIGPGPDSRSKYIVIYLTLSYNY